MNRSRVVAWVVLISIALALSVPTAFVVVKTDHLHDRKETSGGCSVCSAIQNAIGLIKTLAALALTLALLTRGLFSDAARRPFAELRSEYSSPVILRVRLNN
ncbi:MAG: hypothetical protein LBH66_06370 [Oscillospiraceae bacterium]|jgi:hypothetical protein|nr:hypothetical protein [Oscillospiraceae bacterium]